LFHLRITCGLDAPQRPTSQNPLRRLPAAEDKWSQNLGGLADLFRHLGALSIRSRLASSTLARSV
jgi:hypothetical protein